MENARQSNLCFSLVSMPCPNLRDRGPNIKYELTVSSHYLRLPATWRFEFGNSQAKSNIRKQGNTWLRQMAHKAFILGGCQPQVQHLATADRMPSTLQK
jgi:hypothetical protein